MNVTMFTSPSHTAGDFYLVLMSYLGMASITAYFLDKFIKVRRQQWLPRSTVTVDNVEFQLYERTYPSGKKAWRYINPKTNHWVYPRRSELFANY